MIQIENLSFSYGTQQVLQGVFAEIEDGKITTILGANGSGKSTLLNLLSKNLKQQEGEILLYGEPIADISLKNFAKQVAMVHQKNNAPDDLTVEKLVGYGRLPYTSILQSSLDAESEKQVNRALELTDLMELKHRAIGTLSGGQRQRAFIAMALAQNTKYLFLDEPTTFLDVKYQVDILQLVQRLNEEEGITILMVLHDINQAAAYSHQVMGLKDGVVLFQGEPKEVIHQESIYQLYGRRLPVFEVDGNLCVLAIEQEATVENKTDTTKDIYIEETDTKTKEKEENTEEKIEEKIEEVQLFATEATSKPTGRIMRIVFMIVGILALALGSVGVILPMLPTTPFLIVAAICFAKSSEKLNTWFKGTKLYKDNLESFAKKEGMTIVTKLRILGSVTVLLGVAAFFMRNTVHGLIALFVVWIAHLIGFGLCVKTKK